MNVAFHVHSDWSYDGKLSLSQVATVFQRRGYDAVMLCEHCRTFDADRWQAYQLACREVQHGARLIPGIEYSDPDNVVHLPTWGLDEFAGAEVPSEQVLDRVVERGAVCIFAHPSRRHAWRLFRNAWTTALSGYESWNRKTDGFAPSFDAYRFTETGLKPFIALDYHSDKQRMPFVMRVECSKVAPQSEILEQIRRGSFHNQVAGLPLEVLQGASIRSMLRFAEGIKRKLTRRLT